MAIVKPNGNGSTSRRLILAIVFLALLLDNMLLTVVVPIIPDFLIDLEWVEKYHNSTGLWNYSDEALLNSTLLSSDGLDVRVLPEQLLLDVNSRVGWLFSSKAIVQLVANPFIGPVTNRYGARVPLFFGFVIITISTTLYAFGTTYEVLFAARSIQGLSSSCTAIAGMTLLADTYTDDHERSRAMGIALGGTALGVLIGYPFGGFMYEFIDKMCPFLIIAALCLICGALQMWILQPTFSVQNSVAGTSLGVLMQDPYILAASGAILFPEMAMAMLEPTLPIWLRETIHPARWQLGTVFIPDSVGYVIATYTFGFVTPHLGRWLCTGVALLLMGVCLACIPFATAMSHLIVPHFGIGIALGIADVSIMPLLANLVEKRHTAVYGSVYAIAQVAISLGFALGPSLGGQIIIKSGFPWLIRGMALANLLYAPVCYFLKSPPTKDENKSILLHDHTPHQEDAESYDYQRLVD